MKEIVFFDLDGTLIEGQSQLAFLSFIRKKKLLKTSAFLKILVGFLFYKLGIVPNPKGPLEYFFSLTPLTASSYSQMDKLADDFVKHILSECVYQEGKEIIQKHKKEGRLVVLISGTVDTITSRIAHLLGIDEVISTELERGSKHYLAKIIGNVVFGEEKVARIKKYCEEKGGDLSTAWAYGNHQSDLPMLKVVGYPTAINPDWILKRYAQKHNWPILHFSRASKV